MYNALVINDFSGGMTDNSLFSDINRHEILDNVIINEEKGCSKRWGSRLYSSTYPQILNYAQNYIAEQDGTFIISSGRRLYEMTTTTQTEIKGPTDNRAYSAGVSTDNFYSGDVWRDQFIFTNDAFAKPIKVYKDALGVWQVRTAGLPALASAPTVTPVAGANSYLYAFCYYYTYNIGSVTYEDFGGVTYVECTNATAPDVSAIAVTNIPVLVNGTTLNYDTVNIKVKIYRTTNAGRTYYYVGEVANGTTIYNDTTSDADIVAGNVLLYTNNNILDNDEPPLAKYVTILNGVCHYANIQGAPYRARLSKPNDIDSCPADFYIDFDGDITGVKAYENCVIYCIKKGDKFQTYRVSGSYDAFGTSTVTKILIDSSEGCVSNNSFETLSGGVVFAGSRGFAFTNGNYVSNISGTLNKSYDKIVSTETRAKRIYSAYNSRDKLVYFACQRDDSSASNDSIFVLHEIFGINKESCFTTWSNGDVFRPTVLFYTSSNVLLRGDREGFLFAHKEEYLSDPTIDLSMFDPNDWSVSAIKPEIVTSQLFGNSNSRIKYGSKVATRIKNTGNVSVQVFSANDGYKNWKETPEIRRRDQMTWGSSYRPWESASLPYWNNTKDINEIRWLPSQGTLRFYTKQLRLYPSFTIIDNSDARGKATVAISSGPPVVNTVTMDEFDIQTVTFSDVPDAGVFTLDFGGGLVTGNINWNDTDADIEALVQALDPSFSAVTVVGDFANGFVITFVDAPGLQTLVSVSSNTLTNLGSAVTVTPTHTLAGPEFYQYCDNYWISFDNDDYQTKYCVRSRPSSAVIEIIDPYGTLVAGSHKWIMQGYPKEEGLHLVSMSLYYADASPTFTPYERSSSNENA